MSGTIGYNIRPLQSALFEIYQIVEDVCRRNGWRIYGTSGTALGAVRHKGFIPWDDDLDVGMPRNDYEEFISRADACLPSWLRVLSWKNCRSYHYLFGKVIVSDPKRVAMVCEETHMKAPMGIYIDIFPFDGFPKSHVAQLCRIARRGLYTLQGYSAEGTFSEVAGLKSKCAWLAAQMFRLVGFKGKSSSEVLSLHEKLLTEMPFDSSPRAVSSMWFSEEPRFAKTPPGGWFNANDIGVGRDVAFENGTMHLFDNVEPYLISIFGDYMQLPPEDKRHPTHSWIGMSDVPWKYGPDCVE